MQFPKFDPRSKCVKCGWEIPEPVAPAPKKNADGSTQPTAPPPPPEPPTVQYCDGYQCPWATEGEDLNEHLHQWCDTCGYEWLAMPLDA